MLAGLIVAYEIACDDDELLSVVVDGWLVSHPVLTRVVIGSVAGHLGNLLPTWGDPVHLLSLAFRTLRGCRGERRG